MVEGCAIFIRAFYNPHKTINFKRTYDRTQIYEYSILLPTIKLASGYTTLLYILLRNGRLSMQFSLWKLFSHLSHCEMKYRMLAVVQYLVKIITIECLHIWVISRAVTEIERTFLWTLSIVFSNNDLQSTIVKYFN